MVGHAALNRRIGVRVPASQPFSSPFAESALSFEIVSVASHGFSAKGCLSHALPASGRGMPTHVRQAICIQVRR